MKRFLLRGIVALSTFTLNAQNVNIPNANFKAYLVGNSSINTNMDTEIQVSEASVYSGAINCASSSISDLSGIEAFTSLTQLWCGDNQLTSINVSSNTALTQLWCQYNLLTALNVSSNTSLTNIQIQFNEISSIDLSANIAVYSFQCNNNQLTSLNLSANTSLYSLGCDVNQLTSLNVANGNNSNFNFLWANDNPLLTCIEVDDATYCSANWIGGNYVFDAGANFSLDCTSSASMNETTSIELTVFPNPASDVITVTSDAKLEEVSVFDTYGNLVNTFNSSTFSVSHLIAGVYFLTISTDQGTVQRKFIKE